MPKLSRLVAALCLALVAYLISDLVRGELPGSIRAPYLFHVNVGLALVLGWVTIGKRLGHGVIQSMNAGLTAGVLLTIFALFAHASGRVWMLSFRNTYRYPWDALQGIPEEFLKYGVFVLDIGVILVLLIGSALTGVIAELVDRKFP